MQLCGVPLCGVRLESELNCGVRRHDVPLCGALLEQTSSPSAARDLSASSNLQMRSCIALALRTERKERLQSCNALAQMPPCTSLPHTNCELHACGCSTRTSMHVSKPRIECS